MVPRVDKCKTFGTEKGNTAAKQTFPKLFVNSEQIPAVKKDESFEYLRRPIPKWKIATINTNFLN